MRAVFVVVFAMAMTLVMAGSSLAGFPKSRNYMSAKGYARYQAFQSTNVWR